MLDSCCTCYLCSVLVIVIYYLCVVDSIKLNLVMLMMMMEGPERGLANAIEIHLTQCGKNITKIDLETRRC